MSQAKLVLQSKIEILWLACRDQLKKFHDDEQNRRLSIDRIREIKDPIQRVDAYLAEYKGFVNRSSWYENERLDYHRIEILEGTDEDTTKVIRDRMKNLSELGWIEIIPGVWEWKPAR